MPTDLKAELQRLVELSEKATDGPWDNHVRGRHVVIGSGCVVCKTKYTGEMPERSGEKGFQDGDFIVASRNTDFAAVLQRLEELESEVEELKAELSLAYDRTGQSFSSGSPVYERVARDSARSCVRWRRCCRFSGGGAS